MKFPGSTVDGYWNLGDLSEEEFCVNACDGIRDVTRVQNCARQSFLRFCNRTGGSKAEDGI